MKTEDFTFENYPYEPKETFQTAKVNALNDYKDWPNDNNQVSRIEASIATFQAGVRHGLFMADRPNLFTMSEDEIRLADYNREMHNVSQDLIKGR